jgi:hypothetical protein
MKGLDALTDMRQQGKRPECVWVIFHEVEKYLPVKYSNDYRYLHLEFETRKDMADLRPFVGLEAYIHCQRLDENVIAFYRELQGYAKEITVFVADLLTTSIGWTWAEQTGEIDLA